jgi:hypothetical protein
MESIPAPPLDEPQVADATLNPKRLLWLPSVLGLTLGIVLFVTTFSIPIKADDVWWHLKAGETIARTLSIPDTNLFSFTAPSSPWLPHEWLSELLFYFVYEHLGPGALMLLGILLNAAGVALVYLLTARYSRSPYVSALITFLATLLMLGNFSIRPYLFGNLCFIFSLHAMEEPTFGGRLRPVLLFLLFSAWANLHGSFLIGLALILIYFAAAVASHWREPKRNLSDIKSFGFDFLVALTACIFTPNHVFGLIFPFTYLENALSGKITYLTNISEWQSAGISSPFGHLITFYLMFCLFALIGSAVVPSPVHVGLLVAFAFFAFESIRNIPLLGIAATPILARHLPQALSRIGTWMSGQTVLSKWFGRIHATSISLDKRANTWLLPMGWLLLMGASFMLPASSPANFHRITGMRQLDDLSPGFYPRPLIQWIQKNQPGQRIFNYFNWGGAFVYALYPNAKVFIDQRNDCYPFEVFTDYFAVHELEHDWRQVLNRWRVDSIAYPNNSNLAKALLREPQWKLVYQDSQAVFFTRADSESPVSGKIGERPPRIVF